MGKISLIAGLATGYVLGAKAGRKRYEQISRASGKVWHSSPVQKQVTNAKEVARTKAAPAVADLVADAAKATGTKLRQSRVVPSALAGTPSEPPTSAPTEVVEALGTVEDYVERSVPTVE